MPGKARIAFYKSLLAALTHPSFLKSMQCSKKAMHTLLQENGFRQKMLAMLSEKSATCEDVLVLCAPLMETWQQAPPEEGWLAYVYMALVDALYPHEGERIVPAPAKKCIKFYLLVLRAVIAYQNTTDVFDPQTHFQFVTPEEYGDSPNIDQYHSFFTLMQQHSILALMHIGRAIKPFDLLGHVAGVHHIAMHMARQLKEKHIAVDLPLVSAAAASHDLGKYGCRGEEMQRIPYLHYYYTEALLKRYDMESVAHVAANHSTWDLELENLPVEALLLIYADFRVKSRWEKDGREKAVFYSLEDSYHVILSKLDDVDEKKRRRYERVYKKLHDFECYMVSLGANPDPYCAQSVTVDATHSTFLHGDAIVQKLRYHAISHNLRLMHKISADTSFADLLEDARSEKDWQNLRTYINIFEEYFTYMTQKQKQLTMRFLYEMFMHRQGDIRSQAAILYGRILAGYDVVYRKELPPTVKVPPSSDHSSQALWEDTLKNVLMPDHKLAQTHRSWISYTLKRLLPSLLQSCKQGDRQAYLDAYLRCFEAPAYQDNASAFILLDSLLQVPIELLSLAQWQVPLAMAKRLAAQGEPREQAVAVRAALRVLESKSAGSYQEAVRAIVEALPLQQCVCVSYLTLQVYLRLGDQAQQRRQEAIVLEANVSDLFLDNLKTATPWIIKDVNIQFLLYRTSFPGGQAYAFQIATHLANLIRVSERFAVRHRAGDALVRIVSLLTLDQRNEIAVELTRSMESASYEFSKYIPQYLGKILLCLHPKELDEVLEELQKYIKSSNERAACIALPTLGVLLQAYDAGYQDTFQENGNAFAARRQRMLSMLLGGLAHYNVAVTREAALVIGKQIFGGPLEHARKSELFGMLYKKFLLLMEEQPDDTLTFFNHAALLNHIYRFIVDTSIRFGSMTYPLIKKAAFFPGTFDPFSASHKAIVSEIRDNGFEVYLALDEFSWSKRTQPHMVRRRLMNMSVADLFDVYLFPDDIPINIANDEDLKQLRAHFQAQELYISVGSDVIRNASAYKKEPSAHSIHGFHHIVFLRNMDDDAWQKERDIVCARVQGHIEELALPIYLEDVSSSRIRDNIDHNRDISMLVDPVAQGYIYDNGLYLREPQYKELLRPETMYFKTFAPDEPGVQAALMRMALAYNAASKRPLEADALAAMIRKKLEKPKSRLVVIYNDEEKRPLGVAQYYATSAEFLFDEFQSVQLAEYVRRHTSGRIAVIGGVFAAEDANRYDMMRLLVTQVLAECLQQEYTYTMFICADGTLDDMLFAMLERCGFISLPDTIKDAPVYAVDMRVPIVLIEDVQERIKAPLSHDPQVVEVIKKTQQTLAGAMSQLYPGRLVLSVHAGVMNRALVQKILDANHVAHIPPEARALGACMCVPYGKTLHGVMVPNTVTKALHADKTYAPDMKRFDITTYPGYSSLLNQVRTIRSFNRPILLVDDLLHKGYRLEALDPLFKQVNLDVKQIIVGILSGRGKDLMSVQGRQVQSVYFIPNLRYWFVDSMLYPFIGGDSVKRPHKKETAYMLPSVNQILPYTAPTFISGVSNASLFALSLTCLQNAHAILHILERRHQELFGYNLTLNRLGQAMTTARVPDKGGCMHYDRNLSPCVYVENDIEMLLRMERLLK